MMNINPPNISTAKLTLISQSLAISGVLTEAFDSTIGFDMHIYMLYDKIIFRTQCDCCKFYEIEVHEQDMRISVRSGYKKINKKKMKQVYDIFSEMYYVSHTLKNECRLIKISNILKK